MHNLYQPNIKTTKTTANKSITASGTDTALLPRLQAIHRTLAQTLYPMLQNMLFSLIIFATLTSLKPGEPTAILTCKSESGRTLFRAELPSCAYLGTAEFSIDSSKYSFKQNDVSAVIFDPNNKVFTICLESKDPKNNNFIRFWALPNTFKVVKTENGPGTQFHNVYEFKAKIYGREPRKGFDYNTKEIELNCILDYEL
jgi:hypothetical protein